MKLGKMNVVMTKNAFENPQWSKIIDTDNRLVVHVMHLTSSYGVDASVIDPDGLPLVYFEQTRVTRVRKMTDEEYESVVKENGITVVTEFKYGSLDKDGKVKIKKECDIELSGIISDKKNER